MDSKLVSAKLREVVRPLLKQGGFSKFTDRNAWRYRSQQVDVVNYQSFNSYLASSLGCTTYSFSVNLGVRLRGIPDRFTLESVEWGGGKFRPAESECDFRGRLRRSFPQPELDRRDIWYVDPKGKYLERVVENVRLLLAGEGMLWFQRFEDLGEVLRILLEESEDMTSLFGFGNDPSPIRSYMTGYVALAVGETDLAKKHLSYALNSGCYSYLEERLRQDIPS